MNFNLLAFLRKKKQSKYFSVQSIYFQYKGGWHVQEIYEKMYFVQSKNDLVLSGTSSDAC